MISRTKKELSTQDIRMLCAAAGFASVDDIHALGAGEFNAVYAFDAGGEGYALKIAPPAETPVMAYEQNMMRSELFWYENIRMHTDIAVPEIVHTDLSLARMSSGFFIMRRIKGKQMNVAGFTPEERENANAVLPQAAAKLHRIHGEGFGYPQNGLYDTWAEALYAMTGAIVEDAAKMGQPCENGEKTLAYIRRHAELLKRVPCSMVNFDMWEPNVICEPAGSGFRYVLIDPERGFWGDPVMDFICFEFGKPLNEKKASLLAYHRLAEHPLTIGRGEEIRFAFAQAYLGVIMEVERYYRYIPDDEGWTRNDRVCKHLFEAASGCLDEA